jgi:hypothetical protein
MRPKNSLGLKILFLFIAPIFFAPRPALAQVDMRVRCENFEVREGPVDEVACLKELAGAATRDGKTLTLKLKNGATKVISDTKECDDPDKEAECVTYALLGYIGERYFMVQGFPYECGFVRLVNRRNGEELILGGGLDLSPGKKHFVVTASNVAGECPQKYNVAIFSLASDPPRLEWWFTTPNDDEDYSIDRWDGENRVLLQGSIGEEKSATDLTLTDQGWRLKRVNGELSSGEGVGQPVEPGWRRSTTQPDASPPQPSAAK